MVEPRACVRFTPEYRRGHGVRAVRVTWTVVDGGSRLLALLTCPQACPGSATHQLRQRCGVGLSVGGGPTSTSYGGIRSVGAARAMIASSTLQKIHMHLIKRLQYIVCSAVAQTCKLAAVGTRLQSGCCGIDRGLVTWMICSRCPPTSLPPGPPKPASDNINPSRNPRHIKASSILWRSKWRRRARSPTHLVVPAFFPRGRRHAGWAGT